MDIKKEDQPMIEQEKGHLFTSVHFAQRLSTGSKRLMNGRILP